MHSKNKKKILLAITATVLFLTSPVSGEMIMCQDGSEVDPFADNNGLIPPSNE